MFLLLSTFMTFLFILEVREKKIGGDCLVNTRSAIKTFIVY